MKATKKTKSRVYPTIQDLAADLNLSLTSTYDGLKRGDIPHRRIGRRYIVDREMIAAWLKDPVVEKWAQREHAGVR